MVDGCGSKAIGDAVLVGVEAADERMRFQKVQLRCRSGLVQQGTQVAQAPRAMMQRNLGGAFQGGYGMFAGQRQQAVQDPDADGTAIASAQLPVCAPINRARSSR